MERCGDCTRGWLARVTLVSLWNVVENSLEICRHDACSSPLQKKKSMRVLKNLRGTTGEILATPSIEHNGLRGENRFLHEVRRQHPSFATIQLVCLAIVGLAALSTAPWQDHQTYGDVEATKRRCINAHFSILLHVLINATFCWDRNCGQPQRSHRSIHTY